MPAAPVLAGGTFPELTNSWPYWHSLSTKAGGATGKKGVTLPNTPSGAVLVTDASLAGMSTVEGPGLAYTATRSNSVSYAMSQQQTNTVAAKPNPFQY